MAFDFDSFTKLVNSPPAQLVAGAALAGIVWGFFKSVESVLTDDTKLELAIRLLDLKPIGPKVKSWSRTAFSIFKEIYGKGPFSVRANIAAFISACLSGWLIVMLVAQGKPLRLDHLVSIHSTINTLKQFGKLLGFNLLAIHCAYLNALMYKRMLELGFRRFPAKLKLVFQIFFVLSFQLWEIVMPSPFTMMAVFLSSKVALLSSAIFGLPHVVLPWDTSPWTFTGRTVAILLANSFVAFTMWLWIFVISGLVLITARRFDIGFQWFNRKFDIEKKPLSAIGLVAGALVALLYWGFALAHMLM